MPGHNKVDTRQIKTHTKIFNSCPQEPYRNGTLEAAKVGNFYTFQTKKQYIYEELTEQRKLVRNLSRVWAWVRAVKESQGLSLQASGPDNSCLWRYRLSFCLRVQGRQLSCEKFISCFQADPEKGQKCSPCISCFLFNSKNQCH